MPIDMPEITIVHIGLLTLAAVIGVVAGWVLRGNRCAQEKIAVNAGWQEQLEAQRIEHERLLGQNKNLMEQINDFQELGVDADNRAKELSAALKETFQNRGELQREMREARESLETAIGERDKIQVDLVGLSATGDSQTAALQEKDDKIFKLSRELENWQERLPPLIERYRLRDEEAQQLQADLGEARERVRALDEMLGSEQTRVDPIDKESLPDDLLASNDPDDRDENAGDKRASESSVLIAAEDILEVADKVEDELVDNDADDDIHKKERHFQNDAADGDLHNAYDAATLRDDLKQIKGVGPAIEKTLNELGIFRLSQIADMSEYDIDRVARRLKGFRSRIYREDWIGQARDLQDQQKNEQA